MLLTTLGYVVIYNHEPKRDKNGEWSKHTIHDFSFRDVDAYSFKYYLKTGMPRAFRLLPNEKSRWFFTRDTDSILYMFGANDERQKFCDRFLKAVGLKDIKIGESYYIVFSSDLKSSEPTNGSE